MATTASVPAYMLPGVPVHQPAHLEGDPGLATEILPGPPSLVSAQQSAQKRDPRKPSMAYSYLPPSDPGSTYSGIMHGTLIGHEEPRSKRSRNDKGATGRAQRASARNQTATALPTEPASSADIASGSGAQPIVLDAEPSGSATGDDEPTLSRSNSTSNLQELMAPHTTHLKEGKPDKGKGKDLGTSTPPLRVKEEPKAVALPTPEPSNLGNNNDHCSSCRSNGALVYCDGCPRAFHLWCLDPPMESIDEGDSRWFCPACVIKKNPPKKPKPSLMSPLIHQLENSIPVEFQLPDDIRNYFRDVATGPKGTYVDATVVKPPRLNRHGLLEDRDPHRLRDKNGGPVLCFRCGMSALPSGLASTQPTAKRPRRAASKASTPDAWKSIVSCDYCDLHWHLDCLDPPLPAMPPFNKKWMCPNHAAKIIHPKLRIPKSHTTPIEITKRGQWNNGNIEIVKSVEPVVPPKPRVQVDEVLINGRRYRVPEKIVILDFWSKLNRPGVTEEQRDVDTVSALSSPLTSLSSLDDLDDPMEGRSSREPDDVQAAQLLVNFSTSSRSPAKASVSERSHQLTNGSVTNGAVASSSNAVPKKTPTTLKIPRASASTNGASSSAARPNRSAKNAASMKIANTITDFNGIGGSNAPNTQEPPTTEEGHKRRQRAPRKEKTVKTVKKSASARELRSGSRRDSVSSVSVIEQKTTPVLRLHIDDSQGGESSSSASTAAKPKFRTIVVKHEDVDTPISFTASGSDHASSSTAVSQMTPRRRQSRRATKPTEEAPKADETPGKEKRGRKRKTRDDDVAEATPAKPSISASGKRSRKDKTDTTDSSGKKRSIVTPPKASASASSTTPDSTTASLPPPRPPTTPSLKIRLPSRISNSTSKPGMITGNASTPTRL